MKLHPSCNEFCVRDWKQLSGSVGTSVSKRQPGILMPILLGALILISNAAFAEMPGERFDRQMRKFAESCAKRTHVAPGDRTCDRVHLKPAEPLAIEESRFADSIKIHNPMSEDSGYKPRHEDAKTTIIK